MMPKFFINIKSTQAIAEDDEGIELPGLEEAQAEAIAAAREILADNIRRGAKYPLEAIIITDESGHTLSTISAMDMLPAHLKR
jgi:hypothetical protein